MDPYPPACQSLIQQCKQEAKHLLEANVTNRKIHWTHPSFVSFCSSVDDVLSYEVNKKYRIFNTTSRQWLTSAGRVLQEMSKTYPVAMSIYTMCYTDKKTYSKSSRPDYSQLQSKSRIEYKILWIRTAILEKTLKAIVEEILRKPERYYNGGSILCHSVYGELFSFLLDGPCSLNLSRMRSIDTSLISPGPSEIINRYSRVLPTSSIGYSTYQQDSLSSEVWSHIQSLYQTSLTTCLFGKNNILIKPPDYSYPLEGYLTLVQFEASLFLKWLPNALINRNQDDDDDTSNERYHILSLDITNDVAHVHCHQGPGLNESEINLIGYNGIAYPALCFPQPLSLIHFLESLEDGLHPRGCLEPPLWFLRRSDIFPNKQGPKSPNSIKSSDSLNNATTPPLNEEGFPVTWNQVFRVRFSRCDPHHHHGNHAKETAEWEEGHETSPDSESRIIRSRSPNVAIKMKSIKRRRSASDGLEQLQGKVSYQLLARYFYSWLSYCRHINRVKTSLSHLVIKPSHSIVTNRQNGDDCSTPLDETTWSSFIAEKNEDTWGKVVWQIYNGGISPRLRTEVWPYLLKVFSYDATTSEIEETIQRKNEDYENTTMAWKALERHHYTNNDPTSTSLEIRFGNSNTTTMLLRKKGHPNLQQTMDAIMEESHDLIELDSKEDEEELLIDSEIPAVIMDVSDGEIDSGCEDRPHTGMSSDGEMIGGQSSAAPLSSHEEKFLEELLKIDKDIPRCDRDYWYFQDLGNLTKLRNVISSYIWKNTDNGYSQGMCDLLAPLLVTFDDEKMSFICFQKLMHTMEHYFPPKTGVQERMNNLRSLLQILESDFFQYLSELPMGDSLFYSYRWFLVNFKREFTYKDVFILWEACWAAQWCTTMHFEVFVAMAIIQQYKSAIMDAQLDASEILNLFTDLSEKKALNCRKTQSYAQSVISHINQESCIDS